MSGCIFFIYTRFENTHEAIIAPELWDVVQNLRAHRRRPTRTGETALFSGLLCCPDCGGQLIIHRCRDRDGSLLRSYICTKYRNNRGTQHCTSHYIREEILSYLVLENLRKVISYARDYEDEFVQQIMDSTLAEKAKQQTAVKRQLEKQTRRISEIDIILQRLYEDVVNGTLTKDRFSRMSASYEQEQKELENSTAELREQAEACEQQKINIKSFLKLVRSYIEPEQLTPEILRMFVEKIVIHEADKSSGHRTQQIDIHYNFVGQLAFSSERT